VCIVYIGKLPKWIDSYLKTCSYSKNVCWKIFADDDHESTENVQFIKTSYQDVKDRVETLNFKPIDFKIRKMCDYKLAYGRIFQDHLKDFDYWGIGDLDLFYGDVDKFVNEESFDGCDIYTTRSFITGHGTFFKNCEKINNLFLKIPNIESLMEDPNYASMDERRFTKLVRRMKNDIFVKTNNNIEADGVYDKSPFKYVWKNGILKNQATEKEIFYVHFLNAKNNKKAKWDFKDDSVFYLDKQGIKYL
jgi:hypothetical protein